MLASSFFDLMLGIDVHWELVPMPAPVPTPIPNPFTGIVKDFTGLAVGLALSNAIGVAMGGSVKGPVLYWGVIPATNTGTNGEHVPGHILIPPGTGWAPVPKTPKPVVRPNETPKAPKPVSPDNDAIIVFGSKTVTVMGTNAVRMGDIAMSCSEPVRLPSTAVVAVPKGAPILIGGPMSLDIMAAIFASLRTRFISDSLHAGISRLPLGARARAALSWIACALTGHPVDVARGKMMTRAVDAELPGPLPLTIERFYLSNFASRRSPLGYGWSCSLDQAVWEERGKVVLLAEDGREIEFDTFDRPNHRMRIGDEVWNPINRLMLRREANGRWRVTAHDGVFREFAPVPGKAVLGKDDGRARIQRIVSRCENHEISFRYDSRGRLESVRDSGGRLIQIEQDEQDRIVALKLPDPDERGWYVHRKYEYDPDGDLVRVVDSLGNSWNLEYVTHLMVRETDRTGLSFYFEYDGLGEDAWCTRTWGDGGIYDHVINYDKKNHVTYVTNSLGHTTQYHMNDVGLVIKQVDPLGGATLLEYDLLTFQVTKEVDPAGAAIEKKYDEAGNLVEVVAPGGATTRLEYRGRDLVRAVDPRGGEWRWRHNGSGHAVERTAPTGLRTEFEWERGLMVSQLEPSGNRISFDYDERKDPRSIRLPNGGGRTYFRDNLGRPVQIRNGLGGATQIRYNSEGCMVEMHNPATAIQHLAYDAESNLIEIRDGTRHLRFAHARHRIIRREEAGVPCQYEWDTEGRLVAVINERGERYRVVLDMLGREREEIGFDGRKRSYVRDAAGRVVKVIMPSGRQTEHRYDAVGRLVEAKHSDGTFARYEHDPCGLIVAAENESGRVEIENDAAWRVVAERINGREVRSSYGADGERVEMTTSLGSRVIIGRGPAGEPRTMLFGAAEGHTDSPPSSIEFEFDILGMERVRRYSNGIDVESDRDVAGRTRIRRTFQRPRSTRPPWIPVEAPARREIASQTYQWRGDDQISAVLDSGSGSRFYDHDDRGRLIRQRGPTEVVERTMDSAGNIYRNPQGADRRYGPGNRLEMADGIRYEYDEDGNLTLKIAPDGTTWKYDWNGHGALRQVERPDGIRIQFEYDAFARRTAKRTVGIDGSIQHETAFVWDGHVVVHELDSGQGLTTWHWEPDKFAPIAKEKAGRQWMVATDHLGTPTEMYDQAGAVVWKMQLDVFGAPAFQMGTAQDCPWRWPGQYEDIEHGANYNRTRYYASDRGTFLSSDAAGLFGGLNLYKYVSDPLTWIDLLGLTGTYIFMWPTGETYIGKGPLDRARASQGIRAREIKSTTSAISQGAHLDFADNKMGLMVEAELMRRYHFGTNTNMLNAINSPGEKLLQSASAQELADVAKNANALEQDLKKSTGKIC